MDRVTEMDTDNPKRPLAVNTLGRMGIITVVAFVLLLINKGLGFGVLGGLAAFQVILIANVARSMAKAGPMTSVDDVINANVVDDDGAAVSRAAIDRSDDTKGAA